MLQSSSNEFVRTLFPKENTVDNKRPITAVIQFKVNNNNFPSSFFFYHLFFFSNKKSQVLALVETLMSCTPHYVRCLRPNGQKQAKNFDVPLSTSQVRYLGLLENVRVRRAGFVYRQTYERFMARLKKINTFFFFGFIFFFQI